jgi:hypothetical protein
MTSNGPNNDQATPEEHYLVQCSHVDVAVSLVDETGKKLQGITAKELIRSD